MLRYTVSWCWTSSVGSSVLTLFIKGCRDQWLAAAGTLHMTGGDFLSALLIAPAYSMKVLNGA